MLNFKDYLYKNIGNRVKNFRKQTLGITQELFITQYFPSEDKNERFPVFMDRFRLSMIENGRTDMKKNPYLLSNTQIEKLSSIMKCNSKELIFGNENERGDFVKLVLLAIIMNGDKHYRTKEIINPIINTELVNDDLMEFLRISMFQINMEENLLHKIRDLYNQYEAKDISKEVSKNIINECLKWYEENYPFFANPILFKNMSYLMNDFDEDLEIQSNLLIHLLFSNTDFAEDFMSGISNLSGLSKRGRKYINELIGNTGQYGAHAIDSKEIGYPIFVKAFNEMWERNSNYFMGYFEKKLFNVDLEENGLKNLDDEFFHSLIIDTGFENILYKILNRERYNIQNMTGHSIVQYYLQSILIKDDAEPDNILHESGYNLYKYNYDIQQITQSFLDLKDGNHKGSSNLFLYVNDYLKIISFNRS